jgi:hypothetical protein
MEIPEHTFSLPASEKHKLEELEQEIIVRTPLHRLDHLIRENVWSALGVSAIAGLLCSLFCGACVRRSHSR